MDFVMLDALGPHDVLPLTGALRALHLGGNTLLVVVIVLLLDEVVVPGYVRHVAHELHVHGEECGLEVCGLDGVVELVLHGGDGIKTGVYLRQMLVRTHVCLIIVLRMMTICDC